MNENPHLRVRSALPRVRQLGDYSRRGQSPNVDPIFEAYRRDVERNTIRRDPISYPVSTEAPRGRSRERATTTETQRYSTDNEVYQDEYEILCEMFRASHLKSLEGTRSSKEAEHRLKIASYMIQNGAEGHTEQAQREREDSQHGGGATSEFRAERYATEGSDSTMDSTGGVPSRVVSNIVSDPADINDSARRSTARAFGDDDYNSPNGHAYLSNINYALNLTHVPRPSQFYPGFPQHSPITISASGPTPTPQTSAPRNLGFPRRPARHSVALHQCQLSSTEPSTFAGLSFSRAEFEQSIRRNVTRNMNLIPCAFASANPPIPFVAPSILRDTTRILRQPAPDPPICADSRPDHRWNTANTRNWIYQNLVIHCGFPESHAYNIVMAWMGGGMTIRNYTLVGWQMLTGSYHAAWFMWRRMLSS
ncbi:hypothetical protein BTUL_0251g00060 [Botrytis tulipae]|uniref:Uncharacterized protein n=1 Tax=Botrytis tulipae TaxID=87230 RepID=A0A4Z1E6G2_9HELO|nr:hypothetical protein BTUL_0251g00060 [Botrytis tulipae]